MPIGTMDKKTLQDLELPAVLAQVADQALGDAARHRITTIQPLQAMAAIHTQLERTKEFLASLQGDNPIPNHGFEDLANEMKWLGVENSTLEIGGFRRIKGAAQTVTSLKRFFEKYKEFYLCLHDWSWPVPELKEQVAAIDLVIDRYGQVRNDASEQLRSIRKDLSRIKGQINASFTRALNRYQQAELLDDIRETVVDNRRVLAVKAMHRKKVKGAVLGQSRTGSIVYMEPQETLEYATQWSQLLYDEQEEIKRILKALTELIRPHLEDLEELQNYLIDIDVCAAKAKYAKLIDGVLPQIGKQRRLSLKDAYHPLLLLSNNAQGLPTYPQSIELHPENRIVVISGPNAGGKSITLKTVGLLQVMLQSGLLIPVHPMSEFCLFQRILTDIGDNQSIENHLSTYSYRLKKMNQFLKKCNDKTLFLIDEFGTGSDPELGGALAETFLEVFYERGAYGIITTHYTNLKLLASELEHATNANMLFDRRSLNPIFQLQLGEAGSSFTFEVAQKNGIPYGLINRAKKKIERGKVRFDKTLANLQKERSDLRKTSKTLKEQEQKALEESKNLEEANTKAREKLERYQEIFDANQRLLSLGKKVDALAQRFQNNKKKRLLLDELMKLVMVENSKRKPAKSKPAKERKQEKQEAHQIKQEVEQKVAKIRKEKKKKKAEATKMPPSKPKVALKVGDRVRMIDGRAVGTIDSIEKKKAIVNYGLFTADVSLEELEKV